MSAPFIGFATTGGTLGLGTNVDYNVIASTSSLYTYGLVGGQHCVTVNQPGLYEVHAVITLSVPGNGLGYIYISPTASNSIEQNNFSGPGSFNTGSIMTYVLFGQYYFVEGQPFGIGIDGNPGTITLQTGQKTYLMVHLISGANT